MPKGGSLYGGCSSEETDFNESRLTYDPSTTEFAQAEGVLPASRKLGIMDAER